MLIASIAVCVILFAIGTPILIVFSLGGLMILLFSVGFPLNQLSGMFFTSLNSFVLLAGPLFILAGNLMVKGGISNYLCQFLNSFTSRIPGGVAVATVLACTFVGALTGSAFADIAAVGITLFPAMVKAGYSKGYSAAVLCTSGNLGLLIPPSIVFILFGYLTDTSVGALFIAGIVPGILVAVLLCVVAVIIAKRKHFPLGDSFTWKERRQLFVKSLPAIMMPVIVLGGIYGGIFTATESAAVACVYAIIVGIAVYRNLDWKAFWSSITDTVHMVGMILLMVAAGTFFGKALALLGLPQLICNLIINIGLEPMLFLLLVAIVFIILGCFMEGMVIMFVTIPLIVPIAQALDINMLQVGVVFCISVMISGVTPPVSIVLYLTAGMFKTPIQEIIRELFPFLGSMVVLMLFVVFFPGISVWLASGMFKF
jgi:C4-dicarboxylate transporter, DctM subunit